MTPPSASLPRHVAGITRLGKAAHSRKLSGATLDAARERCGTRATLPVGETVAQTRLAGIEVVGARAGVLLKTARSDRPQSAVERLQAARVEQEIRRRRQLPDDHGSRIDSVNTTA